MRLPLYHDAFTIQDLIAYGNVHLARDGSGVHSYIDVDNIIRAYGEYFVAGRSSNIYELRSEFPASEPFWVNATFGQCELQYMLRIG